MKAVVYTDLDGSLLDHYNYSHALAQPALDFLADRKVPVIPVSSKTRAEIEYLRCSLSLNTPFIVENGAAVFIPDTLEFNAIDKSVLKKVSNYWVKSFSPSTAYWTSLIEQLSGYLPDSFRAFSQMTIDEVVELTGLDHEHAVRACQREYSNPLYWYGNEFQFEQLRRLCAERDVDVVHGGRFIHLLNGADKGRAVEWMQSQFKQIREDELTSIALGDGENDLSMLASADIAVQIKSPVHPFPVFEHPNIYRTEQDGPAGWNEAIFKLL